jgi:hypothetical protein
LLSNQGVRHSCAGARVGLWWCISAALLTTLTTKGGAAPAGGGEQNYPHRFRPLGVHVGKGRTRLLREVALPENAQSDAGERGTSVTLLRIAPVFSCVLRPPKRPTPRPSNATGSPRYIAQSFDQLYPNTLRARRRGSVSLAGWNCRGSGEAALCTKGVSLALEAPCAGARVRIRGEPARRASSTERGHCGGARVPQGWLGYR